MNADEVVSALRCCNRSKGHRCSECPVFSRYEHRICKATVDRFAADLIESLKTAGSANYWRSAWETQCAENKKLYEALAESQRRERAAVEDLHKACKCSPCNTGICVKKNCAGNRIPCGFEWRGLQEAEKGETE